MKQLFVLIVLFFIGSSLSAQVGVSASVRSNQPSDWKLVNQLNGEEVNLLGDGLSFGVDYWFRLKQVRVEFLPEINFARYEQSTEAVGPATTEVNFLSFFFNTNFYFLDFFSDCDCPTFSKQSNLLAKGLFVQLSPGISRLDQQIDFLEQTEKTSAWSLSLGAALGYDIGFSNLVTLTPQAGARYFLPTSWDGLSSINGGIKEWAVTSEESSALQLFAGLRLGVRFYE
jgi:hypothetical protein